MTVHTIPADHLDAARGGVLVVDGEMNPNRVIDGPNVVVPARFVKLTEPCKACDGSGHATFGNQVRTSEKCPACDGSGRPLLTVEWESSDVAPIYLGHPMTGSFRAHVLDVVPIVDWHSQQPSRNRVSVQGDGKVLIHHPSRRSKSDITLPPGDHIGRYAVLIEQEQS